MKRRELIKLVALSTGAVLSTPLLSSLVSSCKEAPKIADANYTLQFFNQGEFSLVRTLVDTILPKTDSPSATEVGVHKIIDTMVGTVYKPSDRQNYKQHFSVLKKALNSSPKNLVETLQNLLNSAAEKDTIARKALLEIKQQTLAYYLSTEEIGKKYLNYLPVPGKYEPCISLEEAGGKLWAE
jgi:hypothetical protein